VVATPTADEMSAGLMHRLAPRADTTDVTAALHAAVTSVADGSLAQAASAPSEENTRPMLMAPDVNAVFVCGPPASSEENLPTFRL
jgi:hypothetical protein